MKIKYTVAYNRVQYVHREMRAGYWKNYQLTEAKDFDTKDEAARYIEERFASRKEKDPQTEYFILEKYVHATT